MEKDLFDALTALTSGRVFPDVAKPGTATPYIVYQRVGGTSPQFVERVVPSKKNGRYQLSVWATDRKTAIALSLDVERVLTEAPAFQAKPLGAAIDLYETDTELRGSRQDFSVWSDR
ncbi:MAG: DUF3168 domain-containing protein [Pseudomonadota bacterium]